MNNQTLLMVDDDAVFATRMGLALQERGFLVRTVTTKREALNAIEDASPDFALLDLHLNDGSGLDVLAALHAVRPETRTIILSGYSNLRCTVAAMRAGAMDCISKPADPEDVVQALLAEEGAKPTPPAHVLHPSDARWLHIEGVYNECGGNISETSRRLNMHRRTLQRILARRPVTLAV